MFIVNLIFVLLNGWLLMWAFGEGKFWLGTLNLIAFAVNLIPIIHKLLQ